MTRKELETAHKAAQNAVRAQTFGTAAFDQAFEHMRSISLQLSSLPATEEFCSVDSGVHRTRLSNGRII